MENSHVTEFIDEFLSSVDQLEDDVVQKWVDHLKYLKTYGGRVFVLGVGGGAAAAGHLVQDLRKICGIEAYAPTDSVGELTARTNDDGWDTTFVEYLKTSGLDEYDIVIVLSCSGGTDDVSQNISKAVLYAHDQKAVILSMTGDDDGWAARLSNWPIVVWYSEKKHRTPFTEAMWSVVCHCIVNDPELRK